MERYLKKDSETTIQYLMRLVGIKLEEKPSDLDWQDIVAFTGFDCHYDSMRKAMQPEGYGAYFIYNYMLENSVTDNDIFKALEDKKVELFKEKQKLSDVKNEYRQLQREQAREEAMFDKIDASAEKIVSNKQRRIPEPVEIIGEDKLFCAFADPHYGATFKIVGFDGETLNEYNKEIFEERMWKYRDEILDYCELHNINEVHIADLGDSIEGKLHLSQLQALKSDVVDDIWEYAEFIGDWIEDITNRGIYVHLYTSEGNHSDLRLLTGKKGDFPHENLERIYYRYIKKFLKDNPNFTLHANLNGKNYFDVNGFNFFTVHGQNEKNLKNSINDYEDTYNISINYFVCGHLHTKNEFEPAKGKEVVQARSIMGFNDFAETIKKTSEAGATMFTVRKEYGRKYSNDVKF